MAVDNRLSNALSVLGHGLSTIAQVRGLREEREEERAYQDKVRASQNAFQERLTNLGMQHDRTMMKEGQAFQTSERESTQLFEMKKFNAELAAQEARHAEEMAARWAGIKQSAANAAAARADSKNAREDAKAQMRTERQLKVYEMGMTTAAGQYQATVEAMQKELETLAKDDMLKLNPGALKEAENAVRERYSGQLKEARAEMDDNMASYADMVGVGEGKVKIGPMTPVAGSEGGAGEAQSPPLASPSPNVGSGAQSVDREKVDMAVAAATNQIGASGSNMPSESQMRERFVAAGLNEQEAKLAARKLLSNTALRR